MDGLKRADRQQHLDLATAALKPLLRLTEYPTDDRRCVLEDGAGRTFKVRTRVVGSKNPSFDFRTREAALDGDFLLGAFFDEDDRLLGVIHVARATIATLGRQNRDSFRLRCNAAAMRDTRIERILWSRALDERFARRDEPRREA